MGTVAGGANDVRTGITQVSAGTGIVAASQAVNLGSIGYALVKGDTRKATELAWGYNFGMTGGAMTGAIGLLGGPMVGFVAATGGGIFFSELGKNFGGAYYDLTH